MSVLVGRKAPDFDVAAVVKGSQFVDSVKLSDFKGKYVVLFFYPLDFTFVCPTELHAFQDKLEEFHKRNVELLGCSVDSKFSHYAWLNTPRNRGGIEGVTYTLLSDISKTVSVDYDVLLEDAGVALRGLFLIDKDGGCIGVQGLIVIFGMVHEGEITGFDHMDLVDAAYDE